MFFFWIFCCKSTCPAKWKYHIGMKWHSCWLKHFKAGILNYHLTKQHLWHRGSLKLCCLLGLLKHVSAVPVCLPGAIKRCFSDFGKWGINDSFAPWADTPNSSQLLLRTKNTGITVAKSFLCVLSTEVRVRLHSYLLMLDLEFIESSSVAPSYCICWSVGLEDEHFQVKELYFINKKVHLSKTQDYSSCALLQGKLKLFYQQSEVQVVLLTFC